VKRYDFVRECLGRWGRVVLMGSLDCSELVAIGREAVGVAKNEKATHTAQRYADEHLEGVDIPRAGDLGFYGKDWQHVIHVIVAIDGRHCVSADGATRRIKSLAEAETNGAAVKIHSGTNWYQSAPFLGWRKHAELE
jgi:hypothetical protein